MIYSCSISHSSYKVLINVERLICICFLGVWQGEMVLKTISIELIAVKQVKADLKLTDSLPHLSATAVCPSYRPSFAEPSSGVDSLMLSALGDTVK